MEQNEHIIKEIIESTPASRDAFNDARRKICARLKIQQPPNRDLLSAYQTLLKKKSIESDKNIEGFLRKANIRSLSGIAVITSLVKPYMCPGKCVYCPTEVRMPKSYIASEPAAARSLRLDFDPYELMQRRIKMLENNGHTCDKIEYIVKGGTWNAYTLKYQYWYILESFRACNDLSREHPEPRTSEGDWKDSSVEDLWSALEKEQTYNESASHRIIGITLETRPDAITPKTIMHMRRQGCTRIELGLQAPDDEILSLIKRGHTVDQFRDAMFLLRQAGFKVDLHFMPDLPGTTPEHDVDMYKQLFSDKSLRPDMVKIYPNTVIPSAELYQWYLDGRYKSYGEQGLFDALLQMKLATPRYCRISRLIRDIPANEIKDGNIITNLREALEATLHEQGKRCVCLRCREIGRQIKTHPKLAGIDPKIFIDEYNTRGGKEFFITLEDPDRTAVYGFLRLRIPETSPNPLDYSSAIPEGDVLYSHLPEIEGAAFIRELHTYGKMVSIGTRDDSASQHKGYGKRLVAEAERIVKKHGTHRIAVISGVGVRGYYEKLGYAREGTYMLKEDI